MDRIVASTFAAVLCLLCASCSQDACSTQERHEISRDSAATPYIPKGLDADHKYDTYSYDEFYAKVLRSHGDSELFDRQQVKIYARYEPSIGNGFVRAKSTSGLPVGCQDDVCERMQIVSPDVLIPQLTNLADNVSIAIYFKNDKYYDSFIEESKAKCSFSHPCYIWVLGDINHLITDIHYPIDNAVTRTFDNLTRTLKSTQDIRSTQDLKFRSYIVYVVVEKYQLFESNANRLTEIVQKGFCTSAQTALELHEEIHELFTYNKNRNDTR